MLTMQHKSVLPWYLSAVMVGKCYIFVFCDGAITFVEEQKS